MKMNKKIYIHIGFGKTGTSSLQAFLAQNRDQLLHDGIYYPEGSFAKECHHDLIIESTWQVLDIDKQRHQWGKLISSVEETECHSVILSSEAFAAMFPDGSHVPCQNVQLIAEMLEGYDVTIICYVRRHDSFMPSAYNQWLKSGTITCSPNDFVESFDISFLSILSDWADCFGDNKLKVFPFERRALQPTLIDHFFHAIGKTIGEKYTIPEKKNVSPGGEKLNLMILLANCFQSGKLSPQEYDELRKMVRSIPNEYFSDRKYNPFTPAQQRAFTANHTREYAEIARRFSETPSGELFTEPLCIDEEGGCPLSFSEKAIMGLLLCIHDANSRKINRLNNKRLTRKFANFINKKFN